MKKIFKSQKQRTALFKTAAVLILLILLTTTAASACTGVYVGKEASDDGSTIIARTVDLNLYDITTCQVYDRIENTPGRILQGSKGFTWNLPATTYKYTGIPLTPADGLGQNWDGGVTNEYGLIVSATVTGFIPESVLETDPYVVTGIGEENIAQLLGQTCKTAKEAMQLLAEIIDEKGSSESNIIMAADQDEAWYMEIYSGHQYAAVKMPADKVAVFGNEFMLETLDEYEDSIVSPTLVSHAETNGLAKYTGTSLNLLETYAGGNEFRKDISHLRTWYGHKVFAPSTIGEYQREANYPLFYKPDEKITVRDVMDLFRSRYEGTQYDADTGKYRSIAVESASNAHILQSFDTLPQEMSAVTWVALSEASYSPFVPFSSMVTSLDSHYTYVPETYKYDEYSAYCQFKRLNTLAASRDRNIYGTQIRNYWEETEDYYLAAMQEILKTAAELDSSKKAQRYLTKVAVSFESDAYYDAQRIFDDLMEYMSKTYYSVNKSDSVTGVITDKNRIIPPFYPSFDVGKFGKRLGYAVSIDSTGTVTLEKDADKFTVTPSDGTCGSYGKFSSSNGEESASTYTKDGTLYLHASFLDTLKDGSTYRYVPEEEKAQPVAKSPIPFISILAGFDTAAVFNGIY